MITDGMLTEMAKALASESYVVPSYAAWATSYNPITSSMTAITSEVGTRTTITDSRSGATVTFGGIRSGTSVPVPAGQTLYTLGAYSALTSGTLLTAVSLPAIIHTTTFDIDLDITYTINRQ